jgi:hypothetical protein
LKGTYDDARERHAERLIGYAFLSLAVYLAGQTIVTLAAGIRPDPSPLGIGWLTATVMAMFSLAAAKARTGRQLDHRVLVAESKVTLIDGSLAAAILAGRPRRWRRDHRLRDPRGRSCPRRIGLIATDMPAAAPHTATVHAPTNRRRHGRTVVRHCSSRAEHGREEETSRSERTATSG